MESVIAPSVIGGLSVIGVALFLLTRNSKDQLKTLKEEKKVLDSTIRNMKGHGGGLEANIRSERNHISQQIHDLEHGVKSRNNNSDNNNHATRFKFSRSRK
jgi:ABC-type nickel/cobalt efflux system permease component RcnA